MIPSVTVVYPLDENWESHNDVIRSSEYAEKEEASSAGFGERAHSFYGFSDIRGAEDFLKKIFDEFKFIEYGFVINSDEDDEDDEQDYLYLKR